MDCRITQVMEHLVKDGNEIEVDEIHGNKFTSYWRGFDEKRRLLYIVELANDKILFTHEDNRTFEASSVSEAIYFIDI